MKKSAANPDATHDPYAQWKRTGRSRNHVLIHRIQIRCQERQAATSVADALEERVLLTTLVVSNLSATTNAC